MIGPKTPATVPDVGHELSGLLEDRDWFSSLQRHNNDYRISLATSLTELENWLNGNRTYNKAKHAKAWETMTSDVAEVLAGRGPAVARQTPSITALIQQLHAPGLGADPARRQHCRQIVASSRAELADPATTITAFDDLVAAAQDPDTPAPVLHLRVDILQGCLRAAGRTATAVLDALGHVLDNSLWGVTHARANLGDQAVEPTREDMGKDAGLPSADRLDLCRRLLQHQDHPVNQIVWFCFENASIREGSTTGTVAFGPVTFFDGTALVSAVANGTELYHPVHHPDGTVSHEITPIPPELPKPNDRTVFQWHNWPPEVERWVAARIHIGQEQFVDPIETAAQQADTLVQLASFYTNGTPWRRMPGYKYLRDGGTATSPFRTQAADDKFDRDHTGLALDQLAAQLASHLPIRDPNLGELLEAAAVLHHRAEDLDPTSILDSARVVDRVAGLCNEHWVEHLTVNFAVWWARDLIEDTIAAALRGVQERLELRGLNSPA